jgi:ATP/maltotriose-dependent transcriptional regulator MalT
MRTEINHIPILSTKFHRPPMPEGFVRRTELEARLEKSHQRPLILVSAPAGYGKSTLVANWLEESQKSSAWLSLDEADNNLHQFASYLAAAVHRIFPGAVPETIALLNASEAAPLRCPNFYRGE